MNNFDKIFCSIDECKKRFKLVDTMSFNELEQFSTKCSSCGNWFLKDNKILNKTCEKVCTTFAEKHNEKLLNYLK